MHPSRLLLIASLVVASLGVATARKVLTPTAGGVVGAKQVFAQAALEGGPVRSQDGRWTALRAPGGTIDVAHVDNAARQD